MRSTRDTDETRGDESTGDGLRHRKREPTLEELRGDHVFHRLIVDAEDDVAEFLYDERANDRLFVNQQ